MLREIYLDYGTLGLIAAGSIIVGTVLSWFQAMAGIVTSSLPGILKAVLLFLLSVAPPFSVVISGVLFFKTTSGTRVGKKNRFRRGGRRIAMLSRSTGTAALTPVPVRTDSSDSLRT